MPKVEKITLIDALHIILERKRKGLFFLKDGRKFVGIRSSGTKSCEVERFQTKKDCFDWLAAPNTLVGDAA